MSNLYYSDLHVTKDLTDIMLPVKEDCSSVDHFYIFVFIEGLKQHPISNEWQWVSYDSDLPEFKSSQEAYDYFKLLKEKHKKVKEWKMSIIKTLKVEEHIVEHGDLYEADQWHSSNQKARKTSV